jgi:catechol 2,3-dioxygenase-like lactoylglutathione lyase family enzyme
MQKRLELRYDHAVTTWTNLPLRVFFKMAIFFLAMLVTLAAGAIFHIQSNGWIAGIIFLAAAFGLFFVIKRTFPSVYGRSGGRSHASRTTKKMFYAAGDVVLDVHDVAAAQQWYSEKLGFPFSSPDVEEANMELGYSADDVIVYLAEIPGNERPKMSAGKPPIMFARELLNAHKYLSTRGVDVGPIQSDSGGNEFFRFRDLEGNELEVCQDH